MPPLPAVFLLLFLLAGFVPPAAAQSPPTLSLQPGGVLTMMEHTVPAEVYFDSPETDGPDGVNKVVGSGDLLFVTADDTLSVWRVNAEAGTLSQTAVYQGLGVAADRRIENVDGLVNGLDGAMSVAVSDDGKLLFVAAVTDDALSVWRVNAEAGTLSQTALYQDPNVNEGNRIAEVDGRIDGLTNALGVTVSGNLLFVTANHNDALSVWRVNAEAGTLRRTALYQNNENEMDDLFAAMSVAVSDDGNLLFVTAFAGNNISVWRVNAEAGTLTQTGFYRDPSTEPAGLRGALDVAVSDDLLFVTASSADALSVWRVNASSGTLSQTAVYQDPDVNEGNRIAEVDGRIDGLTNALGVTVSGNLLFVTASGDNALSVWRVNASSGTLSRIELYRDNERGIDGLDGAAGVAVSGDGDLLFVTASEDALSVWQINDAAVSLGLPTVIRVQSDMPVAGEVMVTVTAGNGAETFAKTVSLSAENPSAEAMFAPGTLSLGRWIFTAEAEPPALLDTGAARIAVQVLRPLLFLAVPQGQLLLVDSKVRLTVRSIVEVPTSATYEIIATNMALAMPTFTTVVHPAGVTEISVSFPAQLFSSPGQWEFSIQLPDNSPFRVGDGSTATVRIVRPPALSLQPGGILTRRGDVMPIELYDPGLFGDGRMAVSGELLFAAWDSTLSVWRVNAEAGTLSQTIVYENDGLDNVDNTINGLNGANDIAVSGDLVFVVAFFDNALSVWQVNESSGTLRQTAVYTNASTDNAGNQVDGLGGAVVVDVSDNLLFVGGLDDNALSVWEVNEASGTLRQTAVYLDSAPEVDGLRRVTTIAVSDDLLFVAATGSEALSAWQINADGTLIQTDLHRHSLPGVGLRSVGSMAVSGDLLFVPDAASNRLGVWRVNRETSTLSQTVVYLNSDPEIDGLEEVEGLAVSGGLLFVTSGDDDSLSVWEINALAGTLGQTVVYEDEEDGINGLDGAFDVVANGDLLFVLGGTDNAISTWRILIEVEVRFEAPLLIRVQSDMPVAREVVVTITASNGAEAMATIPSGESSAVAIFAPGTLESGTQTFTAEAEPPVLLNTDTRAARIAVQVLRPLLFLEAQQGQLALGSTVRLTVRNIAGVPTTATYEIIATNMTSAETTAAAVVHPANTTQQEVFFSGERFSTPGQWEFSIQLPDNSPFRTGDGSTAIVSIIVPLLRLVPLQEQLALGSQLALTVQAGLGAPTQATYEVIATNMAESTSVAVVHPANTTRQVVFFSDEQLSIPGQWEFSIQLPDDSPFQVDDNSGATVSIIIPLLRLVPLQGQYAEDSTVTLTARGEVGVPTSATYEIIATNTASAVTTSTTVVHPAAATEISVSFPAQLFSSPGQWEFSIQLPDNSPFRVDGNSGTNVRIIMPLLRLIPLQEQLALGNTVTLTVRAGLEAPTDATYEIIATNMTAAVTSSTTVVHPAGATEIPVSLPAQLFLSPGQWEFSIRLPADSPFRFDTSVTVLVSKPNLDLYPSGMLSMMEHAVLTSVRVDSQTNGLNNPRDVVASGDFLFVTAAEDSALSAWRVDAETGMLSQTALYRDGDQDDSGNTISGLSGAWGAAVSGNLLFVTALVSDVLSVWQVNADTGRLRQTGRYEQFQLDDRENNISKGLDGVSNAAVSGDGKLLFVTGSSDPGTLSVWRVNAEAGTLGQASVYEDNGRDSQDETIDGLAGAQGVAVSGDLLFVTGQDDNALSVWRVNSETGMLRQTALYQDGAGTDGLGGAWDVAVSGDLLFVTGQSDNALSAWRVNAEAGRLSRTALYRNGVMDDGGNEIGGLVGATGIAVSGDVLFVTGQNDDALSVWQVNASSGTLVQAALYQNSDPGVSGLDGALSAAVSGDGDLLFVTAENSDALSAWQINHAEVSPEMPTVIRVQPDLPVYREVIVTVTARNGAGMAAVSVVLSPETPAADAIFSTGTLSFGRWIFTAQADLPQVLDTSRARTVLQVLPSLLSLEVQQNLPLGSTVTLTVRTIVGAPTSVTYDIIAENTALGITIFTTVVHPANSTLQKVFFSPQQIASLGQWEFSIQLPDNSPFQTGDGSTATVSIELPLLQLVLTQKRFARGSPVSLTVRADIGATTDTTYDVIYRNNSSLSFGSTITHPAGVTEIPLRFRGQSFLSSTQWEFSIELPDNSPFRLGDGSTATVQIFTPPPQLLLPLEQPLTAGSTVTLTARYEINQPSTVGYIVTALNAVAAMTSSVFTRHPANTAERSVAFSGQQIASPGQWEFSVSLSPPADLLIEGIPIMVTISLDFIEPQGEGTINADDLVFALRYLVRCEGSAEGCEENGETLASLARNLGDNPRINHLPAALQLLDASGSGEERSAANWFILLLGLQGLPVELLFPDSEQEQRQHLENTIRSTLSVQAAP